MMAEPPVTIRAVHRSPGNNQPITRVVVHVTDPPRVQYPDATAKGMAKATALYFTSEASGGSAHYVIDIEDEFHPLADKNIAWHAPPNPHSIGIEICARANYTRAQWLSDEVLPALNRAAERTRELCERHDVPWVRLTVQQVRLGHKGVCGHVDVAEAFGQSDHTDPGPNFPWDVFMGDEIDPTPHPTPNMAWEYQEAEVRTKLILVGPLDDHGRGFKDWNPGFGRDPIPVGIVKQGSDPTPGSADDKAGDPYWEAQGAVDSDYDVKASPRGGVLRVEVTGGVKGRTVGVYVSAA